MPNSRAAGKAVHCVHPSLAGHPAKKDTARTVSLPVALSAPTAPAGRVDAAPVGALSMIRPSRNGKRRAIVLATVQVLMIAHIVLWLVSKKYGWFDGGRTTTPIEPSESMEFVKNGVVNAGLIFFIIALLSTLILGRWFCGWGCHIVMLQDLCGWMMKKMGVRPKPFRSRFLIYVPLLLALYMFIWPAAYRWGVVPLQAWLAQTWPSFATAPPVVPEWRLQAHLTTTEFWRTFPGVMVAIPFFFVCGFAIVYFLGAKGFCIYGCPYGGFFAPLDKLAPARIIVNDNCEHCGHCTAVCTSNVRVHEEVREYGMVVDPGCMKCLDCVSVCPNEALYFGFARPSIMKGPAKNETPKRKYDLTFGEEILCAGVFALTFFSVRGVYGLIPMLMAAGVAGCVTFVVWKCWRMLRDPNVTLHRFQLKLKGRWMRAGWVFAGLTILTCALVAHCGTVKAATEVAGRMDDRVTVPADIVFSGQFDRVPADQRAYAEQALRWYRFASTISSGGIGLSDAPQGAMDVRRAWLLCVLNRFDDAEALLRRAHARDDSENSAAALAMILRSRNDPAKTREALELYERLLPAHPEYTFMLGDYEPWAKSLGRSSQVQAIHRARLKLDPENVHSIRSLCIILLQTNQLDEGLAMAKRWVDVDPMSPDAHRIRALALADARQMDAAIAEMRTAQQLAPNDSAVRGLLADLLQSVGRTQEAAALRQGP